MQKHKKLLIAALLSSFFCRTILAESFFGGIFATQSPVDKFKTTVDRELQASIEATREVMRTYKYPDGRQVVSFDAVDDVYHSKCAKIPRYMAMKRILTAQSKEEFERELQNIDNAPINTVGLPNGIPRLPHYLFLKEYRNVYGWIPQNDEQFNKAIELKRAEFEDSESE